ncbi:MAG: PilZ domain-containing protein, partial [Elusimicrobia bacterium]|nr:PilZ domain-containing protein [Elusimicrobiota bacterium]
TTDVSLNGAMIELGERADLPRLGLIHIVGDGDTFLAECEIRHNRWMNKTKTARVGVFFRKISAVQSHQLVRLLFSAPGSWMNVQRPLRDSARSFKDIVISSVRAAPKKIAAAASGEEGQLAFLIFQGARVRVRLDELDGNQAVARWPRGFTPPEGRLFLWIPSKSGKERLFAVRPGQFLGGIGGEWSFSLSLVESKGKPVEPMGPSEDALRNFPQTAPEAAQ